MAQQFVEMIRPGTTIEFVGRQRYFVGASLILVGLTFVLLLANAIFRGHALNYGVDFRGGSELQVEFTRDVETGAVRSALDKGGFPNPDVVRVRDVSHPNTYLLRLTAVSVLSADQAKKLEEALRQRYRESPKLIKFEFSEGGDKIYLRFDKDIKPEEIKRALSAAGTGSEQVQRFGRPQDHNFEVVLVGLDKEVKKALEAGIGQGVVQAIPQVESVGAKAGKQLRDDGIKATLYAILLIMLYVALRFDFRYGPGTIASLLHDAIIIIGAFALTYKEFSLTTIAAILTVIGYSMNDTVVVFDRIRENSVKLRDRKFDRVVNASVNEVLSRTILTSATTFFMTLAMNIWGTGAIRDFAFAMNIGIVTGTYSSIFIANPTLIWLDARFGKRMGKK